MKEYTKEKLEDMTTDEVVDLFLEIFKKNMDMIKFNEPSNEEWVFLCDHVGLEFVLKNYKVKDDNTFEVMFQKARLAYSSENIPNHLVLYKQPIDNKTTLNIEYPEPDTSTPFRKIPYPITILNHNGFGLKYKLPKKLLKEKRKK